MEERISTIKELELKKDDVQGMILLGRELGSSDLTFLEEEFDFSKEDTDKFVANYKNVGVVFRLTPAKPELLKDWKPFINRVIKKSYDFDKFHNLLVSKRYDKLLLVTNKRLLKLDIKHINEKIEEINYRIQNYDEKVEVEMEQLAEATKEESKGFFSRVIKVLKR